MRLIKDPLKLLKLEVGEITEQELARTPSSALRAFSRLAHYQPRDEYTESEAQLKRSMIQLAALDLKSVEEATTPESASRAYFSLSHTMIRLARVLITEGES